MSKKNKKMNNNATSKISQASSNASSMNANASANLTNKTNCNSSSYNSK